MSRIPRWIWFLVLSLPLAAGLLRLRFDVEVLDLLPGDVPAVRALKLYQTYFGNTHELIITVQAPSASACQNAARQLALSLRGQSNEVASVTWEPPWQEEPEQSAQIIAYLWMNQPTNEFQALLQRLAPQYRQRLLDAAREELATSLSPARLAQLSYDPYGLTRLPGQTNAPSFLAAGAGWFASPDGTFRLVYVDPRVNLDNYKRSGAWLRKVKAAARQCEQSPHWPAAVHLAFTGNPAFVSEIASGMQSDFSQSALGTLIVIALLFWFAHRRWVPLLWLLVLLGLVVAGTMGAGGLIFKQLDVVSIGFAAILMGLAADYALVLYQEAAASVGRTPDQLRRELEGGIRWSALTTAGAFLLLNFGGLPGLAQLGTLVGIGILLAAFVMLYGYLPVALYRFPNKPAPAPRPAARQMEQVSTPTADPPPAPNPIPPHRPIWNRAIWSASLLILVLSGITLIRSWPPVNHSPKALESFHSQAEAAMKSIESHLNQPPNPLWILISGKSPGIVASRLTNLQSRLQTALTNQDLRQFRLPLAVWPFPERQEANRPLAHRLAEEQEPLLKAALQAGFTSRALAMTKAILGEWRKMSTAQGVLWPTNPAGRWLIRRVAAKTETGWLALGIAYPRTEGTLPFQPNAMAGVSVASWSLLGQGLLQRIEQHTQWLFVGMMAALAAFLWLAFRRLGEMLLSFAVLGFSLLELLTLMAWTGSSWNLMNLTALPLLLGAGVDYTIHLQLALRRHGGNARVVRRITGKALFLCAATTIVGFASLTWSNNAGLASLGAVCATGIACVLLTSLYLLPVWWKAFGYSPEPPPDHEGPPPPPGSPEAPGPGPANRPSWFYRRQLWQLGLLAERALPAACCAWICRVLATGYYYLHPRRRNVVLNNLSPVLGGDGPFAKRTTRAVFTQFAFKMADLWHYEAGESFDHCFTELRGWEHFAAAQARGKGVLLVTPHLGNWEIGAPLVVQRGARLAVVTQAEPGNGFTDFRRKLRARWGVETLVIGQDAFAFLELIHRLKEGMTVALLIDRPPASGGVLVKWFGHPFWASRAPAELAWASGCAILGVSIVRQRHGYAAQLLPEFVYDQAALSDRAARQALTQRILRAFEPIIRQHIDQWYHFVPIWPGSTPDGARRRSPG